MNYDVYLGGMSTEEWRQEFKTQISPDIQIFDPLVQNFHKFDASEIANQSARQLFHIENGNTMIIFYVNSKWSGTTSLLELGDAVGRGKQVIVCLDGEVEGEEKIRRYCEFRGVLIVSDLEELISTVEACVAEIELCNIDIEDEAP